MSGEREGRVALVAEKGSGLMTPRASDDVRVSEMGIRPENGRRDFLLIGDQIFTA